VRLDKIYVYGKNMWEADAEQNWDLRREEKDMWACSMGKAVEWGSKIIVCHSLH